MTREEVRAYLATLSEEDKYILYRLLLRAKEQIGQ